MITARTLRNAILLASTLENKIRDIQHLSAPVTLTTKIAAVWRMTDRNAKQKQQRQHTYNVAVHACKTILNFVSVSFSLFSVQSKCCKHKLRSCGKFVVLKNRSLAFAFDSVISLQVFSYS